MARRSRTPAVLLALLALTAGASGGAYAASALDGAATPVVREALAASNNPAGAKGRTLGLSRVTVQPGAELALHRHPGTQIARIHRGVLTYWVVEGAVDVMRGSPEDDPRRVRRIEAGQRGRIRAGQWIVERPGTIHHAANRGDEPIVIYLATLFGIGAPPSIPVEASAE